MTNPQKVHLGHNSTLAVPGYYRSRELLIRWMQYSAFSDAVFRTHPGALPSQSAQVWDADVTAEFKRYAKVFKAGKAYRAEVRKANPKLPLMRHGHLVYPDTNLWWLSLRGAVVDEVDQDIVIHDDLLGAKVLGADSAAQASVVTSEFGECAKQKGTLIGENQYFIGEELLVAPVFHQNATKKKVWLPGPRDGPGASIWKQVFKNPATTFRGGQFVEVEAGLDRIPVFYRVDDSAKYAQMLQEAYDWLGHDDHGDAGANGSTVKAEQTDLAMELFV